MNILLSVVVLCVIIVLYYYKANKQFTDYLTGIYISDPDTHDNSGIESVILYVGRPVSQSQLNIVHNGHIIITPDILNCGFTISYRPKIFPNYDRHRVQVYIEFDQPADIPTNCICELDIMNGTLILTSQATQYLRLYKEHNVSDLSKYLSDLNSGADSDQD